MPVTLRKPDNSFHLCADAGKIPRHEAVAAGTAFPRSVGFRELCGAQVAIPVLNRGLLVDLSRFDPARIGVLVREVSMMSRRSVALALTVALLSGPVWAASGNAV